MNRPFWSRRRPAPSDFNQDTCDSIDPLLSLYADGMAAPEESRRVETHLASCADCREALVWMQATHRALASRPIMTPPASLQARIAEAIAASSAAPIRLIPIRTFRLRPAYAAAASLTALGAFLLSAVLLHQSASHSTSVHPVPPTVVAVEPTIKGKSPVKPQPAVVAKKAAPSRVTMHHDNLIATAIVPPTKTPRVQSRPKSVSDNKVALVVKVPTSHSLTKELTRIKPNASQLATISVPSAEHKRPSIVLPMITPKTPPVQEANNALPTVPVKIGPPIVTTQTETSHIQLARGILGDAVVHMQNAGYATVFKPANRPIATVHGVDVSDAKFQSITSGTW